MTVSDRHRAEPFDINAWRKRMGLSITDAAMALGISRTRLVDNLYMDTRPASARTVRRAKEIESGPEDIETWQERGLGWYWQYKGQKHLGGFGPFKTEQEARDDYKLCNEGSTT